MKNITMKKTEFSLTVIFIVIVVLCVVSERVFAYTYCQVGVNSNFLIYKDKVCFVQADDTLTVLNLEDGNVVARKSNFDYGGSLFLVEGGLFVQAYDKAAMVDLSTFDLMWQADNVFDTEIAGQYLISDDANDLVECRNIISGDVLWSYNLPGALELVVEKGKVLVFRSAVYDEPEDAQAIVLLDIETGKEILHKTAPSKVQYIQAYFDGNRIYLASGLYENADKPYGGPGFPASAPFEKLLVWDLEGNEIDSHEIPSDLDLKDLSQHDTFTLLGKTFYKGRVWASPEVLPPFRPGQAKSYEHSEPDSLTSVKTKIYNVAGGEMKLTETNDSSKSPIHSVELDTAAYSWKGFVPYLGKRGMVVRVGSTGERLLLGSNLGHVECIDMASGRSMWIYKFPTIRYTMSFSSNGMPPYLATANAIYKRENQQKPISGLQLEDSTGDSKPNVIYDPSPKELYKELPGYLKIVWTGGIASITSLILLVFLGRIIRLDSRAIAFGGLIISTACILLLYFYGRVSISSSIFLRFTFLLSLVAAFIYSVVSFRRKHRLSACLLLIMFGGMAWFGFPIIVAI